MRKLNILLLCLVSISIFLVSGCVDTNKQDSVENTQNIVKEYVCSDGTIVSDSSLCTKAEVIHEQCDNIIRLSSTSPTSFTTRSESQQFTLQQERLCLNEIGEPYETCERVETRILNPADDKDVELMLKDGAMVYYSEVTCKCCYSYTK